MSIFRLFAYLLAGFFLLISSVFSKAQAAPISAASATCDWQSVTPDLEAAETTLSFGLLSSANIYLYRTTRQRYTVEIIRAQRYGLKKAHAKDLCQLAHASVCINASFFDEQHRPLGLLIEKGTQIQKTQNGGNLLTGIFQVNRENASIVHRGEFNAKNVLEAVQAGPRLIMNGQLVPGLSDQDVSGRRSGVCIDSHHRVILYAMTAAVFGIPIQSVQSRLKEQDIDCVDALNLDGGSSTQLYGQPYEITGEEEVPVAIGLFPVA